jgi:hypothetical protein
MILVRRTGEDSYVGVVTPMAKPFRRVPAAAKGDWIFSTPISRTELSEGLWLRGQHNQDVGDVFHELDTTGWSYAP